MVLSLAFILALVTSAIVLLIGIVIFSEVVEAMEITLPIEPPEFVSDTFGFVDGTDRTFFTNNAIQTTCPSGFQASVGISEHRKERAEFNAECRANTITYDITAIPDNADVTKITLRLNICCVNFPFTENSQIFQVTKDPSTMTDSEGTDTVFKRGGVGDFSGTTYIANDSYSTLITPIINLILIFPTIAETDLETALSSGQNFLTYAFNFEDLVTRNTGVNTNRVVTYTSIEVEIESLVPNPQVLPPDQQQQIDTFNNAQAIGFTVIGILPVALFFALFSIFSGRLE